MKLVVYKCLSCLKEIEELFKIGEKIPKERICFCGKRMKRFDFKNNKQRVFIYDPKY